jgi:hypothetical protein
MGFVFFIFYVQSQIAVMSLTRMYVLNVNTHVQIKNAANVCEWVHATTRHSPRSGRHGVLNMAEEVSSCGPCGTKSTQIVCTISSTYIQNIYTPFTIDVY